MKPAGYRCSYCRRLAALSLLAGLSDAAGAPVFTRIFVDEMAKMLRGARA